MRFGNAAWGLRELPLEEQLRLTRSMGLELLELSIGNYAKDMLQADSGDTDAVAVAALYAKYGISPECCCTGNDFSSGDPVRVAGNLAHVKKVIDLVRKVGGSSLRIFAGFASDSLVIGDARKMMLQTLQTAAEYAASRQVVLTVETHGCPKKSGNDLCHCATATTRKDFWPAILKTGVFMLYDPANLAAVGDGDPCAMYREFAASIRTIHLKDFRNQGDGIEPVACGEGRLDWKKVYGSIRDFSGPVLIEYEIPDDVENGLRRSLDFLHHLSD